MSLHTAENGVVTLSKARHLVCMEAAWELEALAYVLPKVTTDGDEEDIQSGFVVRGIASRIVSLAHVLMSALYDDMKKTEELECQIKVRLPSAD